MCSKVALPQWYWTFILGAMVFVFWILLEKKFAGVGGKFGTTAMVAGLATSLIIMIVTPGYGNNIWINPTLWLQMDGWLWLFGILLGALACAATLYVRNKGELVKNTTVAASMIGLIGALVLLLITTKPTGWSSSYGATLAAIVYTAAFAGMASKERLDHCNVFSEYVAYAITGAIAGALFMAVYGFLLVGGRYGFIGFCSVLIYNKLLCPYVFRKMAAKRGVIAEKKA